MENKHNVKCKNIHLFSMKFIYVFQMYFKHSNICCLYRNLTTYEYILTYVHYNQTQMERIGIKLNCRAIGEESIFENLWCFTLVIHIYYLKILLHYLHLLLTEAHYKTFTMLNFKFLGELHFSMARRSFGIASTCSIYP